jgi:gluconolactonase
MFAAPEEIRAEPFARLPDSMRVRGRSCRWVDVQRHGVPTDSFLEGPSFDRQGRLYVVDVAWGRIFRVSPGGQFELFTEYDGEPNGLKIHKDGRIFITDYRHGLMVANPDTGHVEPHLERGLLDRFKGLNDLFFASNGDLYFTDQGLTGLQDATGALYRLRASGRLERLLGNVPSPNGLAMNPGETLVYLNVTRANAVWRVPLTPEGEPFKVGVFLQLSGGHGGPDGLAIDEAGSLAIAHFGLGSVWLFSALGEPLYRIRSPDGLATTNVAYRGRQLYITESETGTILRAELPVPGRAMYAEA